MIIIVRCLFGDSLDIGKNFYYRKGFKLTTINRGHVIIGQGVFFNTNCSINCCRAIKIGNHVMFGSNVHIYDHDHKYELNHKNFAEQGYTMKSVTIGDNCWIATNVVILKGVQIGNDVVIGANCTINVNIPDGSVVFNDSKLKIQANTKKYRKKTFYEEIS